MAISTLEGRDIICISVMDWDHPFKSSRHHLMGELASRNRVLFVDNQFNPLSVLKGLHQAPMRRKLLSWTGRIPNPRQEEPGLWVYTPPPVIPMGRLRERAWFERAYAFNQRHLREGVRNAARALNFKNPLLWISFNVLSSESLIGALDEDLVIYHCTDEITATAGISPFAGEIERRLIEKSHLIFTSSRRLLEDKCPGNLHGHFVPNGADTALFETALWPLTPVHSALEGLRGPILAFAGHIEARFDFALMEKVAASHPEWNLVIAGPVAEAQRLAAQALARRPNVKFLGLIERDALPGFLKGADVALIPFVHSPQTRAIYPLKLNEYLAAGKPVVVTPFADLREFEGLIAVGDGEVAFAKAVSSALQSDSPERRAGRVSMARANAWANRISQMEELIISRLEEGVQKPLSA